MQYKITNITKKFVDLEKNELTLELPVELFDTLMIHEEDIIEINITISYNISSQRRKDIREHREDEARNNNI